jgi:hypothetical protein
MSLTRLKTATAVLAVALLVTTQAAGRAAPAPPDQKQEVKVKWEYKAIPHAEVEKLAPRGSQDKLTDGLNALGEAGWELVTVVHGPGMGGGKVMQGPGIAPPPMQPGLPGGPVMGFALSNGTYVFKRAK